MTYRIIYPDKANPGVYSKIWNNTRDTSRGHYESNLCYHCKHQIMLHRNDIKVIISKLTTKRTNYYHGTLCHVCGKNCGIILIKGDTTIAP